MNSAIIDAHNSVVSNEDIVWHIGDFSMLGKDRRDSIGKVLSKLNGAHHLVLGNHDKLDPCIYRHWV